MGHDMHPMELFVTFVLCFGWTSLGNFIDSFGMVSLVSGAFMPALTIYLYSCSVVCFII